MRRVLRRFRLALRRMPASLTYGLALFLLAIAVAVGATIVTMRQSHDQTRNMAEQVAGGDVERGRAATVRFGCAACHELERGTADQGRAGPSLAGVAVRAHIAGRLPNRPDQMIAWLMHPQEIAPGTGMPDQNIDAATARDIAAFLYTLRD